MKNPQQNIPVLETERLILRPPVIEDAPAIQKYFNHWDIIKHLSKAVPWPYPDDGAENFLSTLLFPRMESGDTYAWAITVKSHGDEFVGLIDYRKTPRQEGNRGFWIATAFQRQGYMTEAIHEVNEFLFGVLNVKKYIVGNIKTNIASRRVKEKTGAVFLKEIHLDHHTGDGVTELWEVTKDRWLENQD